MISNFWDEPSTFLKVQQIATADPLLSANSESTITNKEAFGIVENEHQTYKKSNVCTRDAALINKYLADSRNSHMNERQKPVTSNDIDLSDVDKTFNQLIRDMSGKHENMWNGRLAHIKVAEHAIDLKGGPKPFKSAPHCFGPTAQNLEPFELKKQLETKVFEPAVSEWATSVLFVPVKDVQQRFCVDYCKRNELTLKDSY